MKRSTQYVLIFTHLVAGIMGAKINSYYSSRNFTEMDSKIQVVVKSEVNDFNSKLKKSLNALAKGNFENANKYCIDAQMIADTLKKNNVGFNDIGRSVDVVLGLIKDCDDFDFMENRFNHQISLDFFKDIDEGYADPTYVDKLNMYLFGDKGFVDILENMGEKRKKLDVPELRDATTGMMQEKASRIMLRLNDWLISLSDLNRSASLNDKRVISKPAVISNVLTKLMASKAKFKKVVDEILR